MAGQGRMGVRAVILSLFRTHETFRFAEERAFHTIVLAGLKVSFWSISSH